MTKRLLTILGSILAAIGLMLALTTTVQARSPKAASSKTLDNLQAAYNAENNDHVRYLAFARRADEEGYGEVASLFRAVARGDEIHMNNHAAAIRKMGAEPQAELATPVVRSTRENLSTAVSKSKVYERDTLYPRFIEQARLDGNQDAATTFFYAEEADAEHYNLFHKALVNLEHMRGKSHTYYVCTTCGDTTEKPVHQTCRTCSSHVEKFEAVS